jgi:hypothetical protein
VFPIVVTYGLLVSDVANATLALRSLNLVVRIDACEGTYRYERSDPAGTRHHHSVCDRCGKVIAFTDPSRRSRGRTSGIAVAVQRRSPRPRVAWCLLTVRPAGMTKHRVRGSRVRASSERVTASR